MKWLANTLAALADIFEPVNEVTSNLTTQPMALRVCTGTLGPNQLAWCDANLHGFKKAREQAEAAWSEPRLPLVDPINTYMADYAMTDCHAANVRLNSLPTEIYGEEPKTLNEIIDVIQKHVPATK